MRKCAELGDAACKIGFDTGEEGPHKVCVTYLPPTLRAATEPLREQARLLRRLAGRGRLARAVLARLLAGHGRLRHLDPGRPTAPSTLLRGRMRIWPNSARLPHWLAKKNYFNSSLQFAKKLAHLFAKRCLFSALSEPILVIQNSFCSN